MPTFTERLSDLQITGAGLRRVTVETAFGGVSTLRGSGGRADAPPLVLLHGMGSCASDLAGLLRRLRRHASLRLAPDLPGHGHSPVPVPGLEPDRMANQLADALARLLDRPAVVFGSSLGGLAAVRFAQRHPERVQSLVLASPAGAPMPDLDLQDFFERLRIDDASDARRFIDQTITRTAVPRTLLAWGLRDRFDQPHIARLLGRCSRGTCSRPTSCAPWRRRCTCSGATATACSRRGTSSGSRAICRRARARRGCRAPVTRRTSSARGRWPRSFGRPWTGSARPPRELP